MMPFVVERTHSLRPLIALLVVASVAACDDDSTGPTDEPAPPRIIFTTGDDMSPEMSPDGTQIVFTSMRDDPGGEIYIMKADGTAVTRLTVSLGGDTFPRWLRQP
jgi:tricorn protease-like protein